MSKNPLTHYCISCGEPFQTDDPKMVLCAACGGEPESSPLDKPEVTQAVPLPSAPLPKREASQASSDWQVGDVILDTYEVKGELGQGGFGKVYRVHHK
ncbi:MAG: hypothetical protein MUC85_11005, partial [Anaerolineales bacterium]|nr:hypothetical protein [Anaerolineales bacterium]